MISIGPRSAGQWRRSEEFTLGGEVRSGAVQAVPWDEAEKQVFGPQTDEGSPQAKGSTISNVSILSRRPERQGIRRGIIQV